MFSFGGIDAIIVRNTEFFDIGECMIFAFGYVVKSANFANVSFSRMNNFELFLQFNPGPTYFSFCNLSVLYSRNIRVFYCTFPMKYHKEI
jgi:hypothetical protein